MPGHNGAKDNVHTVNERGVGVKITVYRIDQGGQLTYRDGGQVALYYNGKRKNKEQYDCIVHAVAGLVVQIWVGW